MDMTQLGAGLDFMLKVGAVVTALNSALYFLLKSRFTTKEEAAKAREETAKASKDIRDELKEVDHRLTGVETAIKSMPTAEQLHGLHLALEKLTGQLNVSSEKIAGLEGLLERVETQVRQHAAIFADVGRRS